MISVVTCTFNSEKYLKKAWESVQKQTYKNIEHIINDSYSTDKTLEIKIKCHKIGLFLISKCRGGGI